MNEADPYDSVSDADAQPIEATVSARRQWPTGLTVICVLAIVLGSLGILAALAAGVQLAVGQQLQQSFQSMGAPDQEIVRLQQEMQSEIQAVVRRFFVPQVVLLVAKLALCVAMIYGAVRTLTHRDSGRRQLAWIFAFLIGFEIIHLVVFVMIQLQMRPIMAEYMPKIMNASGDGNAQAAEFGQVAASVSIIAGLIFRAAWALAKIIYYGISRKYLRKAEIRQLFESAAT